MNHRSREDGAIAVVIGLASVLLFGLAAVGVDLGNAYSRDRESQTQADLMALAVAHLLPRSENPDLDRALLLKDYAAKNPVYGQGVANFVDADPTNGWVEYDGENKLRVFTPEAWVQFGLAGAIGFSGADVTAKAAVEIRSPGRGPMPLFAVEGCDYGLQSLADGQPNSTPPTADPTLSDSSPLASATVTAVAPTYVTQSTTPSVTITGSGFTSDNDGNPDNDPSVKAVGFYRALGNSPEKYAYTTGFTVMSDTQISVANLSTDITGIVDTWYVRVLVEDGPQNNREQAWTEGTIASALIVEPPGPAPTAGWVECSSDPNQGNFGTIELPRAASADAGKWIEWNILKGLDPNLSLKPFPGASATDAGCDKLAALPTIASTGSNDIEEDTNCINTKPMFPGAELTAGLIEGLDSLDGLLDTATSANPFGTSPAGCAPDGTTAQATTSVLERGNGSPVPVNNDLLTCFLVNDSTTLGQIAQPNSTFPASAKHSISDKIFRSPRFIWVPVFADQPTNGLDYYKLVGFRAGFITDQPATATRANREVGSGSNNGLIYSSNGKKIRALRVVYFNSQALPEVMAANGPTFGYIGSGTKVPTLVE